MCRLKPIPAAGIHGVSLKTLPGNVIRLVRGFFAARRILHEFKPDVLFFTGGYVAVPLALAGETDTDRSLRPGYRTCVGSQDSGTLCRQNCRYCPELVSIFQPPGTSRPDRLPGHVRTLQSGHDQMAAKP